MAILTTILTSKVAVAGICRGLLTGYMLHLFKSMAETDYIMSMHTFEDMRKDCRSQANIEMAKGVTILYVTSQVIRAFI